MDPRDGRKRMASAAAVLSAHFGATVDEMRNDVRRVGRVGQQGGITEDYVRNAVMHSLVNNYVNLSRFQMQPDHNAPNLAAPSGLAMAQSWGQSVASRKGRELLDIPREASDHTQGLNQSRFVSLTANPNQLHNSTDPWARRITRNAAQLHTYTIPKRFVRDANRINSDISMSARTAKRGTKWFDLPTHLSNFRKTRDDSSKRRWVMGVPRQEQEVLYMGNDLNRYRTLQRANPYRGAP